MGEGRREHVGVIVIHGVGETEPGWIEESLIPPLRDNAEKLWPLSFADHSEVRRLDDIGRVSQQKTFEFRAQRGSLSEGPVVSFMELYWADLSKVGTSVFSKGLALLQLFFEAPLVLSQSLLARPLGPLHWMMHVLTLFAAWLIRWPIAGINMAVFTTCLVLVVTEPLRAPLPPTLEPFLVSGILLVLAVLGFWFASWRWRHDIVLTEISIATSICSIILTLLILAQVYVPVMAKTSSFAAAIMHLSIEYMPALSGDTSIASLLVQVSKVIFLLWLGWTAVVVAACAVLFLMMLVRLPQRLSTGARRSPAVTRSAAAIGLVIAQGLIWKIVVSLFSILLVGALVRQSVGDEKTVCLQGILYFCDLRNINVQLFGVFAFNLLFALGLAFLFATVGLWRSWSRRGAKRRLHEMRLPRLIVPPVILATLIIGTLVNAYTYYIVTYEKSFLFGIIKTYVIDNNALVFITGGSIGLFLFLNLLRALQEAAGGVLHIGRDLVDHQYRPARTMARFLMQRQWRKLHRYPRRMRIQGRLDSMVKNFVNAEQFDRIVFVAHSQGSVIMYDYLKSPRDNKDLADIKRIDVVTLGSPLTHLYQYYFAEYEAPVRDPARLHPQLASWTNMWRIDDPIGNRVEIVDGDFIQNRPLKPGGHIDYWKEKEVCQIIVDLIAGEEKGPDTAARPSPEAARPLVPASA